MTAEAVSRWLLAQEARAMLTRLARLQPFALSQAMVPAAALPPATLEAIEVFLRVGRRELRARVHQYIQWLDSPEGAASEPAYAQRRFSLLRLRFNQVLVHFDIFSDALTQRGDAGTGISLAGLDAAAADALETPGHLFDVPPLICYIDRGHGAAIRRARTRLPGGGENPVAIIRLPRERMVGSGIASSLIHEVGHQATALLGLLPEVRANLQPLTKNGTPDAEAWALWDRWISEILADLWAMGKLGIGATMGLMSVVSLPRPFVFRLSTDDPHPMPWIRVLLSCAIGRDLFPHKQWDRMESVWQLYYPAGGLRPEIQSRLDGLRRTMPEFVDLLVDRPLDCLRGQSFRDAIGSAGRQPATLAAHFLAWKAAPEGMHRASPVLALAAIGQARADCAVTPEQESRLLITALTSWALRRNNAPACTCEKPKELAS